MRSDPLLLDDIKSALINGLRFNDREIAIAVEEGRVTLTGQVHSHAELIAVTRTVGLVEEVSEVVNQLVVAPGHGPIHSDDDTARSVRRALDVILGIRPDQVTVTVEAGRVILEGHVQDPHDRESAEDIVRHLAGVRRICNHISTPLTTGGAENPLLAKHPVGIPWGVRAEFRNRGDHALDTLPEAHHPKGRH